ncbi:MAG TPA: xanthine dehydrogenase family protein subunit M, partial [Proteobacteria bacterium]|nr:xanthine dehydrogenase family protein subunit M [Pseudomonadota bacterium]
MIPFNLERAESLEQALEFLDRDGTEVKIIAGGTDLMVELREISPGEKGPGTVLDITPIDEIRGIKDDGSTITVGALTPHREISS